MRIRKVLLYYSFVVPIFASSITNIRTIDYPGGLKQTNGAAINNAGVLAGFVFDNLGSQAFYWDGSFHLLNPLDGASSYAHYVSNDGTVVGDYQPLGFYGFLLDGSSYTKLKYGFYGTTANAMNDLGQIVGGADFIGYSVTRSNLLDVHYFGYPDTNSFTATGINNAGLITGAFQRKNLQTDSYIYDGTTFTIVSFPGADYTRATWINNRNEVVGYYHVGLPGTSGPDHGFIYRNGDYESFDVPGATSTFINGVNDVWQISGSYIDASGVTHAFIATELPEPSSGVLLLSGIYFLLMATRASARFRALSARPTSRVPALVA